MKTLVILFGVLGVAAAFLPIPKIPEIELPASSGSSSSCNGKEEEVKPGYNARAANGGPEFQKRKKQAAARVRARWNALSEEEREDIKNRAETFGAAHKDGDGESAGEVITRVNAKAGLDFFDGDLMLTKDQLDQVWPDEESVEGQRKKRQGWKTSFYPGNLWLDTKPIPYDLDSNLDANAITLIHMATQWWEDHTCITFAHGAPGANRLNFTKGQGCWAWMGKIGGSQEVSIGQYCDQFAVVAHEIGHALGFIHSQMRIDRDDYVDINLANVQAGYENAFDKYTAAENENYGLPYDFTSVMQYSPYAFAQDPNIPTVTAKPAYSLFQNSMGQTYPSFTDVVLMNELYKCYDACAGFTTYCHNQGRMDPKNCSRCFCTPGFTGEFCSKPDLGTCGQLLPAKTTESTLKVRAGINATEQQPFYHECIFILRAPVGMRVKVTVVNINGPCTTGGGCGFGGIEIRPGTDKRLPGYRYCCGPGDVTNNPVVTSETPTMVIYAFNRYYFNEANIKYQAVP